jgi:hypothetical protein
MKIIKREVINMLELKKVTKGPSFKTCNPDYGEPPSCDPEAGCDPDVPCDPSDKCAPTDD